MDVFYLLLTPTQQSAGLVMKGCLGQRSFALMYCQCCLAKASPFMRQSPMLKSTRTGLLMLNIRAENNLPLSAKRSVQMESCPYM